MAGVADPSLACVVNVSEGRDAARLTGLDAACGPVLLDRHSDPDHHRSVLTLVGPGPDVEAAVRRLATEVVNHLDLSGHRGAHPRLGVLDVVPFVSLDADGAPIPHQVGPSAVAARDGFMAWAAQTLALPTFAYGPPSGRTLPEIRRRAFVDLRPDAGPAGPHPSAGACAAGARGALVAYNVWVGSAGIDVARAVAGRIRSPQIRALGLEVGRRLQVSCNLVDPWVVGPAQVYDLVAALLAGHGAQAQGGELVGLMPAQVLAEVPERRWDELGLSALDSIEARVSARAR